MPIFRKAIKAIIIASYSNIIYDEEEELFKTWYNVSQELSSARAETAEALAYAISKDGIHWEKPHHMLVDGPAEIDRTIWPPYPMTKGKTNLNNLVPFGHPRDLWLHLSLIHI